jgi:WD40 repeat protein
VWRLLPEIYTAIPIMFTLFHKKLWLFALVIVFQFGVQVSQLEAIEPEIIWEKNIFFSPKMAKRTGDVIFHESSAIYCIDSDGNTFFKWVPDSKRIVHLTDISADGKAIVVSSSKKSTSDESQDLRISYFLRDGHLLWSKPYSYELATAYDSVTYKKIHFSPDGRNILFVGISYHEGGGRDVELWDAKGNKLWLFEEEDGVEGFEFSPDSKFIVLDQGAGGVKILDISGKLIYTDSFGAYTLGMGVSVSQGADYIGTSGVQRNAIIDKEGTVVLDAGDGADRLTLVSHEGMRGLIWNNRGLFIYELPTKKLLKSYKINAINDNEGYLQSEIDISSDARYIILSGNKKDSESKSKLFIIDTLMDEVWETYIPDLSYIEVSISYNGQFALVSFDTTDDRWHTRFYKIY